MTEQQIRIATEEMRPTDSKLIEALRLSEVDYTLLNRVFEIDASIVDVSSSRGVSVIVCSFPLSGDEFKAYLESRGIDISRGRFSQEFDGTNHYRQERIDLVAPGIGGIFG